MKRCPTCNRVEAENVLAFCRVDGTRLVSDSSSISGEAGTAQLGSAAVVNEGETSILSHTANTGTSGATQPTSVLPAGPAPSTTPELIKPKRRKTVIAGAALITLAIAVGGYFYYPGKSKPVIESIAGMPFVNESGNQDVEYLSDGMTETLINTLSRLPNLNVKARSSVFRYKGKETNPQTIGKELNVQAILNGRVTQRGEQLTLSLELIDAQTENVIWSEQYNRKQADLVTLQSEIARDVSSKLKTKLSGADQAKLEKKYTENPEAYRLYLQGRFYWNKRAGKLFERAKDYFQQAVENDPNFALGLVGLADVSSDTDRTKAKEYVMRALSLDDGLAEAHATLGYQYLLDCEFAAAERELKRSMELNPNYASAHQWNGSRLMMLGRYDEAFASHRRALDIEPTSAANRLQLWNVFIGVRKS